MEAADYFDTYNMKELDEIYTKLFSHSTVSLKELWEAVYSGNYKQIGSQLLDWLRENTVDDFHSLKNYFQVFLLLGLLSLVVKYISVLFTQSQTAEVAKQVLLIIFLSYALAMIVKGISISQSFLEGISSISMAALPIYLISMSLAYSVTMASAYSQIFAVSMFVVERIIMNMVFPLLSTLEIIKLLDDSLLEERFHTGVSYGEKMILYIMKGFVCGISAFGYIQANVLSVSATVKKTAIGSFGALLPGVGRLTEESLNIFWGSTSLIFRCMGNMTSILLLMVCFFPFIKMFFLLAVLRLSESFMGFLGEKTLQKGIRVTGDAIRIMMRVLFDTVCLFLLTIAVASLSMK